MAQNHPSYEELLRRAEEVDEWACDGSTYEKCSYCTRVLETIRGSVFCEECGHLNPIGHDCREWKCVGKHRICRHTGYDPGEWWKQGEANHPPVATSNPARTKLRIG